MAGVALDYHHTPPAIVIPAAASLRPSARGGYLLPLGYLSTSGSQIVDVSGRTVRIANDERLQHRLRKLVATPKRRGRLRQRVTAEHRLAPSRRKQ